MGNGLKKARAAARATRKLGPKLGRVYTLHKWSMRSTSDPFRAPELVEKLLVGFRDNETRRIITSAVVNVDGRRITTYSGSVYVLDDIDPEYLAWMKTQGLTYDPENPIKVR
jgi:hypothetical protein